MDKRLMGYALAAVLASASAAVLAGEGARTAVGADQTAAADSIPEGAPPAAMEQTGSEFSSLDANGDGYVSREEAGSDDKLAENWDDVDQNSDGQVDQAEFARFESGESGAAQEPDTTKDTSAPDKPYGSITNEKPGDAEGPPKLEE